MGCALGFAWLCLDPAASVQGSSRSSIPGVCLVLRPSRTDPGSLISAARAPLIPHCQLWQFLLGERVPGRPQECALQGREIPERNRKAAASLLHLALYPPSPSSRCRDSDTSCSTEILPGIISVGQAALLRLRDGYRQRYRRVRVSSCEGKAGQGRDARGAACPSVAWWPGR